MRRLLIQTRSPIVERDLDLIKALGTRAIVSITIETDDDEVRRALTPTSPSVERRLKTARMFREANVFTQIAVAPMMPTASSTLSGPSRSMERTSPANMSTQRKPPHDGAQTGPSA
jgi:DNA repair photolyase